MTGEQKPGGLEVVDLNGLLQQAWDRLHRPDADVPGAMVVLQAMLVALERPLTPAGPAEARIRDAERAANDALDEKAAMAAEYVKTVERLTDRATAAEAKLARAAHILRNANLHEATRIVDALAALQQEGE